MTNTEKLRKAIDDSGYTYKYLAAQLGITREALYRKVEGKNEFTASQIAKLAELLKLNKDQIGIIFLQWNVN